MQRQSKINDRGSFLKGILLGVIITILVISISVSGINIFRKYILKDLSISQKISEIENIIDKHYVNEYEKSLLEEAMYKGMVISLNDPYSYYMTKEELNIFLQDTEGNYVGIGIEVRLNDENKMIINKVFEGSPAEEAGLKVEDIILKVENSEITTSSYKDILAKIKGEEGTNVNLTVSRPKENKTLDFTVTRKSIDVPTVKYNMLQDNIGYISISQFDRVTTEQFKNAFNNLSNAKGLIIDLRNNPGGLLTTATAITDMLVPKGTITYIEDKNGKKNYSYSDENYYNKPLVILVNENSASASEVLSGAVKDFGVGKLVGEKTYGKGVVQNLYKLSDDSGIKVTIAKYYTPNGICINGTGIEPDIKVLNDENSSKDLQLEKAIETINNWK